MLQELGNAALESKALDRPAGAAAPRLSTAGGRSAEPEEYIRVLQLMLNQVSGREVVKPDGVYGPRTKAAIEHFQETFGLAAGGDVQAQLRAVHTALLAEARRRGAAGEAAEEAAAGNGSEASGRS